MQNTDLTGNDTVDQILQHVYIRNIGGPGPQWVLEVKAPKNSQWKYDGYFQQFHPGTLNAMWQLLQYRLLRAYVDGELGDA